VHSHAGLFDEGWSGEVHESCDVSVEVADVLVQELPEVGAAECGGGNQAEALPRALTEEQPGFCDGDERLKLLQEQRRCRIPVAECGSKKERGRG
jgi:hypothetical protein